VAFIERGYALAMRADIRPIRVIHAAERPHRMLRPTCLSLPGSSSPATEALSIPTSAQLVERTVADRHVDHHKIHDHPQLLAHRGNTAAGVVTGIGEPAINS
jgi:hypothetical protein